MTLLRDCRVGAARKPVGAELARDAGAAVHQADRVVVYREQALLPQLINARRHRADDKNAANAPALSRMNSLPQGCRQVWSRPDNPHFRRLTSLRFTSAFRRHRRDFHTHAFNRQRGDTHGGAHRPGLGEEAFVDFVESGAISHVGEVDGQVQHPVH